MRIVFVGATGFSLRSLETVLALRDCSVVGVVTLPEVFSISYRPEGVRNVLYADLRPVAERHGIPVQVMHASMNDAGLVEQLRAWQPDLLLVVGWYHLLPRTIHNIAPALGLHASLLPDYSGGAPLVWAMINGEKKTGITLFRLDDGVDSGPILGQAEEAILEFDTIATLYARIELAGLRLLETFLPQVADGTARYRPQDAAKRRVFPQRAPIDGRVDWRWSAWRIYNFVRAQTRPYPGAFSSYDGNTLRIWGAVMCLTDSAATLNEPGQIDVPASRDGALVVRCGDGKPLALSEVEYRESIMSGSDFFRSFVARTKCDARTFRLGQ